MQGQKSFVLTSTWWLWKSRALGILLDTPMSLLHQTDEEIARNSTIDFEVGTPEIIPENMAPNQEKIP